MQSGSHSTSDLFLSQSIAPKVEREILVTLLTQGSRLGASHAHSPSGIEKILKKILYGKVRKN
jgi:hypothetical protein